MAGEEAELDLTVGAYRGRSHRDPRERFWSRIEIDAECWVQTSDFSRGGYGHFSYTIAKNTQRQVQSHRLSWEMLYGPVPKGMKVCHTCDNPPCVRPSHLWLGTDYDNAWDKMRKGRDNLASRRWDKPRKAAHNAKLNPVLAEQIRQRRAAGESGAALAAEYNTSRAYIYQVARGGRWSTGRRYADG